MMRTLLSPEEYWKPEQLDFNNWHFVGLAQELKNHQDYVTANVFGKSVFVQNMKGELRAFRNVCPYRYSELKSGSCGNSPLQCPYHGWAFDETGRAVGIPGRKSFCLSEHEQPGLEHWQLSQCGSLLFVKQSAEGHSLLEYLGNFFDELNTMSSAFGQKIDQNEINIKANWKIVVENTLEDYHVKKVHPETFGALNTAVGDFKFSRFHSSWSTELGESVSKQMSCLDRMCSERAITGKYYRHWFMFPNLTLATTFGLSFALQQIIAVSAGETRFISQVFLADIKGNAEIKSALAESIVKFNQKVFEEDRVICEAVQRGITQTEQAGFLCEAEKRIEHFHRSYLEAK